MIVNNILLNTGRKTRASGMKLYFTRLNSSTEKITTVSLIPKVSELTKKEYYETDENLSLLAYLNARSLAEGITDENLYKLTESGSQKKLTAYCGADPSAKSLHLGNLLPLMALLHFKLRGSNVVGLVGGATGVVGDPSGRTTERKAIEQNDRLENVKHIQNQISSFLERGIEYAKSRNYPLSEEGEILLVNNASWWEDMKLLDFLTNYGRHIRLSAMLARESIQSRLKSNAGIGYNEFSYQILQAYDFWHLHKNHGVNMQIGGNDQWGNIVAGIDLVSRLHRNSQECGEEEGESNSVFGLTVPLLTTPSGEKFGKSAGNAVFISEELTSSFDLYQYFINSPDDLVGQLLRVFTLLPLRSIEWILKLHEEDPGLRIAQRTLAREVVDLVRGVGVGDEMSYITSLLFPTPDEPFDDNISADKLISIFKRSGILIRFKLDDFNVEDLKMSTLLAKIMGKSKTETKSLIKSGGIYLGLEREQFIDPDDVVLFDPEHHLIEGKLMLVRSGKQKYYVVEFV